MQEIDFEKLQKEADEKLARAVEETNPLFLSIFTLMFPELRKFISENFYKPSNPQALYSSP